MCNFCPVGFGTLPERDEHIYSHFEQQTCEKCEQMLVRIADSWFVLHATVTCIHKGIKQEMPDETFDQSVRIETEHIVLVEPKQEIETIYGTEDPNLSLDEPCIDFETFNQLDVEIKSASDSQPNVKVSKYKKMKPYNKITSRHFNKITKVWECEHCSKTFSAKFNLYVHNVRIHCPQDKQFRCDKCKLTFATKTEVYRHNKIRRKVCNVCHETFCSNALLGFHREKQCTGSKNKEDESNAIEKIQFIDPDVPHLESICKDIDKNPIQMDEFESKEQIHENIFALAIQNDTLPSPTYKCKKCSMTFSTKHSFQRHNKIVRKRCESCNQTFCSISMLRFHKAELCSHGAGIDSGDQSENSIKDIEVEEKPKTYKNGGKTHQCKECPLKFQKKAKLRFHFVRIHMPSLMKYKCDNCKKQFVKSYELTVHQKHHIICNNCGDSFCAKSLYLLHQQDHSKKYGIFNQRKCKHDGCNEIIAPNEWIQHLTTKHNDIYNWFECDICKKRCSSKGNIRNHILTSHCNLSKPFKCDTCECSFITMSMLNAHRISAHTNEHNFICSECGKTFKKSSQLKLHSHTHTGAKPFECLFAGCSKRFRGQPQRIEHMRMHTGEKPYVCTVEGCDRQFAYSISLRRHKYSAHKIYTKKYPCEICSEIFPETVLLKKHIRHKHGN